MKRVLIQGGTGFIGRQLAASLARSCESVAVLTRNAAGNERWTRSLGIEAIELHPAKDPMRTRTIVAKFDTIFNLAGSPAAVPSNVSPQESLQAGAIEQLAVLEACAAAGHVPHVVFASSRLVYGQPETLPVSESCPLEPRSFYAAHKVCVEHYHRVFALQRRITFTIARISNPYGIDPDCASRRHGFINQIAQRAANRQPIEIFGDGSQLRDYIHISDLVSFLEAGGTHPAAKNQVFNTGSGVGISIRAAAEQICALTGAQMVFLPWPEDQYLVESGDYVSDIGKARELLNYSPRRSFAEAIAEIVGKSAPDRPAAALPATAR